MKSAMKRPTHSDLPPPGKGRAGWPWTEGCSGLAETMPDGKAWPKISIVTPSYNQGQFIEETIRSVLLQGYPNLEYMIIDGGSTDDSVEIIKRYERWITYWTSKPDRGQSHAINKGFVRSTGQIIAWLNSDDVYAPKAFEKVAVFLGSHSNVDMVYGICKQIDELGDGIGCCPRESYDIRKLLCFEFVISQPAVFLRKYVAESVGYLDEGLHVAMDTDLWIRIALAGFKIEYFPELLSFVRMYRDTKTHSLGEESCKERLLVMDRVFSTVELGDKLLNGRSKAYSHIHEELAHIYYEKSMLSKARFQFLKAIYFTPSRLRSRTWLSAFGRSLLGHSLVERIKTFLRRNKWKTPSIG